MERRKEEEVLRGKRARRYFQYRGASLPRAGEAASLLHSQGDVYATAFQALPRAVWNKTSAVSKLEVRIGNKGNAVHEASEYKLRRSDLKEL